MKEKIVRDEVEGLIHAYVHCIDDDRLEEWPNFFTETCLYKVIPRENVDQGMSIGVIYCDSRGMLKDRVVAYRDANLYAPFFYRHLVSNVMITGQENGIVSAQSNYVVYRTKADPIQYGETEIYNAGKYVDKIVFENGVAKFKEKIVVLDTCRIKSLLVVPL
jgi:anthranilate 1,2-dioxygenase small subunit